VSQSTSLTDLGRILLQKVKDGDVIGVRALLAKGATFVTDWLGSSPLHYAAQYGQTDIAAFLIRAGVTIDGRNKVERTPLHVATCSGHTDLVHLFLHMEADVDCQDMLQMTPLHFAVERDYPEIIELLLKYGAKTGITSKFYQTCEDIAVDNCRMDIYEMLQKSTRIKASPPSISSKLEKLIKTCKSHRHMEMKSPDVKVMQIQPIRYLENIRTNNKAKLDIKPVISTPKLSPSSLLSSLTGDGCVEGKGMKLLAAHGITMLPEDDKNLVSTAVDSGHDVSLTEAGRLALGAYKRKSTEDNKTNETPVKKIQLTNEYLTALAEKLGVKKVCLKAMPASFTNSNNPKVKIINPTTKDIKASTVHTVNLKPTVNSTLTNLNARVQVVEIKEGSLEEAEMKKKLKSAEDAIKFHREMLQRKITEAEGYKRILDRIKQKTDKADKT